MARRGVWVFLLAAAALLLPTRQSRAERDYDFAKALWLRGFTDLAVDQYRKVLTLPSTSAEEKARAHLDLAGIYQEQADQTTAAAEYQALVARARTELDAVLRSANQNVVLLYSARRQQAELLQNHARYLAGLLSRSDFAGDRSRARTDALKAFDESVTGFQALAKDAKDLIVQTEKERKTGFEQVVAGLSNERVNAALRGLWSEYYAAMLFDKQAVERKSRLEKAAQGFGQFAKEWDGLLVALYGHLGEGACYLELGEPVRAQAKFGIILQPEVRRLEVAREACVQALIYRAAGHNLTDQPGLAIDDLNEALLRFPSPERSEIGRQALLERAKALEQVGARLRAEDAPADQWQISLRQALAAARLVSDRPGPYADQGTGIVTRVLMALGTPDEAATMGEALGVADESLKAQHPAQALSAYRRAIDLARDPSGPAVARAWFGVGRCYYYLKAFLEAAVVFDYVRERFPASGEGPRAAYLGVQAWAQAYDESKQPAELRASLASLDAALARYGQAPEMAELQVLSARLLAQDGRYEQALAAYAAVPEHAPGYARTRYEAGMCAWQWFLNLLRRDRLGEDRGKAQYDAAVTCLKAYLQLVSGNQPPEELERLGQARIILATIHTDLLGDGPACLNYLAGFNFPEAMSVQVLPLRLKGLIQAQRVEEAVALLAQTREAARSDPERFRTAFQMIAQALDEQAEAVRRKGAPVEYRAAAARTADFLQDVLRTDPNQGLEMYQFVAARLIRLDRFQEAQAVLTTLIERAGTDPKNETIVAGARQGLVECLMGARAWGQAITLLKSLQAQYPESARLKTLLGACYIENGQSDVGVPILDELFKKVYKAGTRPWYEVGLTLGRAYRKAGQDANALKITSYVQVLYPDFWNGRDPENVDLTEAFRELHIQCGGAP
jgi:tetratricopeptide (TPR) repeat protein